MIGSVLICEYLDHQEDLRQKVESRNNLVMRKLSQAFSSEKESSKSNIVVAKYQHIADSVNYFVLTNCKSNVTQEKLNDQQFEKTFLSKKI